MESFNILPHHQVEQSYDLELGSGSRISEPLGKWDLLPKTASAGFNIPKNGDKRLSSPNSINYVHSKINHFLELCNGQYIISAHFNSLTIAFPN